MTPNLNGNGSGITEMPSGLRKHEWKIIGGRKAWKRICPQCNEDVWHYQRAAVYRKSRSKNICRKCWIHNKTNILERNCPACNVKLLYSNYKNYWKANKDNTCCASCSKMGNSARAGQKTSTSHRNKLSVALSGKVVSAHTKLKMREAAIRRMDRLGITQYRSYNPNACLYFDNLSTEMKWELQHAKNGGEVQVLGYFLDAYDKNRNIVIEYDEMGHNRPSKKKRDAIRQAEIIDFLHCEFYRYNEDNKQLVKMS